MNRAQAIGWAKLGRWVRAPKGPWLRWNGRYMVRAVDGAPVGMLVLSEHYETETRQP